MLRTGARVLAATLAVIALAPTPASSRPCGERFGPDAKYRGGSNSDPVIGGPQNMQGGPWTVPWKRTFDYQIARKLPRPPPKRK